MAVVLAPAVLGQTTQLNPTVRVLPKPTAVVPADCDVGTVAAPLRAPVEELAEAAPAAAPVAPPQSDLRTALRRVQTAAENNDYNGFKSALADARAASASYPAGGEKKAATDVLQTYADIETVWDYANTNPTGAFFDASNSDVMRVFRKYPGLQHAVADATMTIGDRTLYPSHETRTFLTEESAKRLRSLGVRTPARVAREVPVPRVVTSAPARPKAPRRAAALHRAAPKRSGAPAPSPAEGGAPAPPPASSTTQAPQPVPAPAPVTETTASAATTSSAVPETATTVTEAQPQQPAQQQPAQQQPQAGGINITFAVILIVVGIGVLIVLFRASD